jgi:hypothetical protein
MHARGTGQEREYGGKGALTLSPFFRTRLREQLEWLQCCSAPLFPIVASSTRALSDNLMSPQCWSMCDWHQQQQCNLAPTPNDAKPWFILFSASVTRCVQRDVIVHPVPHPVVFRWRFFGGEHIRCT